MSSFDDELALFESELAELDNGSQKEYSENGPPAKRERFADPGQFENATISAPPMTGGSTLSEPPQPPQMPQILAPPPFLPPILTGGNPFIANSLGRPPMPPPLGLPPMPPHLFVPHQIRGGGLMPPMPPPHMLGAMPGPSRFTPMPSRGNGIIEGAPALYDAPAINSIPPEQLRTQALQSDIDAMAFKRQTEPLKRKLKDNRDKKKYVRSGGGQVWEDPSLAEWDDNDFRVFCGDLGNEVSDELLAKAFRKYPSFQKAKVVRESRTNKSKGYGFVSFRESDDYVRAMREMDGKYVGNRPIKLRKSSWKDRNLDTIKKKKKQKKDLGLF